MHKLSVLMEKSISRCSVFPDCNVSMSLGLYMYISSYYRGSKC